MVVFPVIFPKNITVFIKKKKNIFLNLITAFFTIGIFYFVFRTVDFSFFVKEFKNINFYWLAAAYLFLLLPKALIALRWKILIAGYKQIALKESLKLQFAADTISILVPLKIGEFISAFYDNDEKYTARVGISAGIFEKILDFVFIFLFSIIGIAYFWGKDAIPLLLFFLLLFCVFFVVFYKKAEIVFSRIAEKTGFFKKLGKIMRAFFSYSSSIQKNKKELAKILLLSLASLFLSVFQGYLIFLAISAEINPVLVFGAIPVGILIAIIPVTFFGIGTRDAAFVFLLGPYLATANIVLFGIFFALRYVIMAIIGLFCIKGILKKTKLPFH